MKKVSRRVSRLTGERLQGAKLAWQRTGGLSKPSKMPCHGFSIPADQCKLGSILRAIKGTTCSKCYAKKNMYTFPSVVKAMDRRFKLLRSDSWVNDMALIIRWKEKSGYFRWFDSGDLQGVWTLRNIALVCFKLPDIEFWLPTREFAIVKEYLSIYGHFPSNLIVRVSATMIDGSAPRLLRLNTSTVVTHNNTCKAPSQNNECKDCRKCWNKAVPNVSYHQH